MNQVFLVVQEVTDDGVRILAVCDTPAYAAEMEDEYKRKWPNASIWVVPADVLSAPPKRDYRVWIRFGEGGIEYKPELRLSIPMVGNAFEPLDPGGKYHGSITVVAAFEGEAIFRAKGILRDYLRENDLAVLRKEGYVGVVGADR